MFWNVGRSSVLEKWKHRETGRDTGILNNIIFAFSTYKLAFLLHFGLVSLRDEDSLLAPLLVGRLNWFQLWLREFCQCLLNGWWIRKRMSLHLHSYIWNLLVRSQTATASEFSESYQRCWGRVKKVKQAKNVPRKFPTNCLKLSDSTLQ